MSSILVPEIPEPGFSFELCQRNAMLIKKGLSMPNAQKTGTTIAGIVFKDGVILGADTRATENTIVADKFCTKIHYLAQHIYCCGAGTAADTDMVTQMISSQLELHRLNTGRLVPVATANTILSQYLFRYQGHVGAALVLGGVDSKGAHIYCIYPHGSSDYLKYTSMGSGSLAAMSVLETKWRPDLTEGEGKELMAEAIGAGVFNDLGSGNNIDLCVIRKGSTEYIRPYSVANEKGERHESYRYNRGTTAVLNKQVRPVIVEDEVIRRLDSDSMDTSS